jgi:hypothetical protein
MQLKQKKKKKTDSKRINKSDYEINNNKKTKQKTTSNEFGIDANRGGEKRLVADLREHSHGKRLGKTLINRNKGEKKKKKKKKDIMTKSSLQIQTKLGQTRQLD